MITRAMSALDVVLDFSFGVVKTIVKWVVVATFCALALLILLVTGVTAVVK